MLLAAHDVSEYPKCFLARINTVMAYNELDGMAVYRKDAMWDLHLRIWTSIR